MSCQIRGDQEDALSLFIQVRIAECRRNRVFGVAAGERITSAIISRRIHE